MRQHGAVEVDGVKVKLLTQAEEDICDGGAGEGDKIRAGVSEQGFELCEERARGWVERGPGGDGDEAGGGEGGGAGGGEEGGVVVQAQVGVEPKQDARGRLRGGGGRRGRGGGETVAVRGREGAVREGRGVPARGGRWRGVQRGARREERCWDEGVRGHGGRRVGRVRLGGVRWWW